MAADVTWRISSVRLSRHPPFHSPPPLSYDLVILIYTFLSQAFTSRGKILAFFASVAEEVNNRQSRILETSQTQSTDIIIEHS